MIVRCERETNESLPTPLEDGEVFFKFRVLYPRERPLDPIEIEARTPPRPLYKYSSNSNVQYMFSKTSILKYFIILCICTVQLLYYGIIQYSTLLYLQYIVQYTVAYSTRGVY